MATYKELLEQRAALDAQIESAKTAEISTAVAKVREIVAAYGLTAQAIFPSGRARSEPRAKVAIKYRDPATGATWTGRGKSPRWIADKNRADYEVH